MTMRINLSYPASCGLALLLTVTLDAAPSPLLLTDPNLPLQELRPLDRHVWVLSLEGNWKQPALPGVAYHVNLLFPNGQSYSHRVLDDAAFRAGEVRCLIPEYQLVRNGLARGGRITIVVSARRTVASLLDPEIVSAPMEVAWPMNRPINRWPPRTRFAQPEPIDAFRPPSEMPPPPASPKSKLPPPLPERK
jgi:hypothetical protein